MLRVRPVNRNMEQRAKHTPRGCLQSGLWVHGLKQKGLRGCMAKGKREDVAQKLMSWRRWVRRGLEPTQENSVSKVKLRRDV